MRPGGTNTPPDTRRNACREVLCAQPDIFKRWGDHPASAAQELTGFVTPCRVCFLLNVRMKTTASFVHGPPTALPESVVVYKEVRPQPVLTVEAVFAFMAKVVEGTELSHECSLVCLIYVERLMETARVPLLQSTWKPIIICGLLVASKVRTRTTRDRSRCDFSFTTAAACSPLLVYEEDLVSSSTHVETKLSRVLLSLSLTVSHGVGLMACGPM